MRTRNARRDAAWGSVGMSARPREVRGRRGTEVYKRRASRPGAPRPGRVTARSRVDQPIEAPPQVPPAAGRGKGLLKVLVRIVVGVGVLAFLLVKADVGRLWDTLRE